MSLHSNKSETTVALSNEYEDKPKSSEQKDLESKRKQSLSQRQTSSDRRQSRIPQGCSGYNNPDDLRRASYILETAPFPAMGSLDPIARTLSANTQQSARSAALDDEEKQEGSVKKQEDTEDNKPPVAIWDQPLPTEGWRNPGWLAVIGTFLVNFVVFGNSFSWGIFQELYLNEVYKGQATQFNISWVGTISNSFLVSLGVFLTPLIRRFGFRATMSVGVILVPLGMVLASYVTSMWQLYLTQGVLFGLGGAFVFSCSVTLPTQWFYKNRGLATGIAVSGSGIGGVALAPLSTYLIQQLGYRQALRVLGGMYFGILCIAVGLARSRWRPPPSPTKGIGAFWDPSMATSAFGFLMLFSLLVPFGYVGPFFLAPTYATYLGQGQQTGSNMVSIMCGMNAICRISLGFLADKTGRLNTMFACTFLAGVFIMVIWQVADSYGVYVAFCVLYGLTGGGWVSLFPVVAASVVGVKNIQRGMGLCYFTTMFGNLVGTPIIGLLQSSYGWTAAIQFAGAPTVAAGLVMLVLRFKLHPQLFKRV